MNKRKIELKIIFCRLFSSFQNTLGYGKYYNGVDVYENHYLNANIRIPNAKNFSVEMAMNGVMGAGYISGLTHFLPKIKIFRPRSSALICTENNERIGKPYRQLEFGKRHEGDFILRIQQENVISQNEQLPRYVIDFENAETVLTLVIIRLNVSKCPGNERKNSIKRNN